jgi:ABC-type multidrug transport system ATPase subunit
VLREASLVVPPGEHLCVRGRNGAGKTTLLRVVAGAIRPGRGVRRGPRASAYVPPSLAPPTMTVTAWLRGVRRGRVDDPWNALAILGFDGDADSSCRELSFGNLRKVLLADAFTSAAPLLAIDEVHVGLDHPGRTGLERLLADARARGVAVIVAAQDDDSVPGADRTVEVGDGRVREVTGGVLDVVRRSFRGPRASEPALLDAAERLGFRPDDGGDDGDDGDDR